jgi:hypothetical protein
MAYIGDMRSNERDGAQIIYLSDNITAVRVATLASAVAALWCFVSQWSYYGVSDTAHAWNGWIIGAIMFLIASARAWKPWSAAGLSWANAVLGAWIFVSPWVFGYTNNMAEWINSLSVGLLIFSMSVLSARITKRYIAPLYPV